MRVHYVIGHVADDMDIHTLANKVSEFHAGVIERQLKQSGLTTQQKIIVIDRILQNMKSREVDGLIK